jgi:hypothetical protein
MPLPYPRLGDQQTRSLSTTRLGDIPAVKTAGRTRALLALAAVVAACGACVSPAIDSAGYEGKTNHAAQRLEGIVNGARLAAQLDLEGRMLRAFTDDIVSQADQDAGSLVSQYDSVQPPNAAMIALRNRADNVLQPAASSLADLRIAVRDGDHAGMRKALEELAKSASDLEHLQAQS